MTHSALLLGAIGVLAETSDLQRRAFNTAFEMNELVWHWDAETYAALLEVPGGRARLAYYAKGQGVHIDIDAVYEAKVAVFEAALADGVELRPGIADVIAAAQAEGMRIGFATSTDPRQVAAILKGVSGQLDTSVFAFIGDNTQMTYPKPAPDIYHAALTHLGIIANDAIAIEDTPESASAAVAAGIRTFAYPGAEAVGRDFGRYVEVLTDPRDAVMRSQVLVA